MAEDRADTERVRSEHKKQLVEQVALTRAEEKAGEARVQALAAAAEEERELASMGR